MWVHDITFRQSLLGGTSHEWKVERNQYEIPPDAASSLTKAPLTSDFEWGFGDATAQKICMFRFVWDHAGWRLIAREANFASNWGPAMTVFT